MQNRIEFKVTGRFALFTDPLTKIGGEKCSYHIPTYEALKGIVKSVYWKPTFTWIINRVRVMRRIRTQAKSMKPLIYGGGNSLAIYTYLADVEYQIEACFEWNPHREDMVGDRDERKHWHVAQRMVEKGGRQDIFLGTRECQGEYDGCGKLAYGLMFHGFDYPDETGKNELQTRFWKPVMADGIVTFSRPEECTIRKFVREMIPKLPSSVGLGEKGLEA
jgi:CRISPR-associated protein Cas5d